ncbi:hypothetical protein K6U06_00210 [Acidiferrimicrobium sp. IK]|uniref:hypothetical protein n=1 Tax=Acidiferrimicrobium sp. IK TaxID=2871700 RepID=UPI0021CB00DD|nr:hypothetical protein [Acidiferrimicrobium sp. IK]MCU4182769.1 hypothetical protein [Acidiferrimicrobium sp. IK]
MTQPRRNRRVPRRVLALPAAVLAAVPLVATGAASAGPHPAKAPASAKLIPGDLLVATSDYQYDPSIVAGQTQLPPGCQAGSTTNPCSPALTDGGFPEVFNNSSADGSFGITSKIVLDEMSPTGRLVGTVEVPNSTQPGYTPGADQMVTSYSSKSELALNLSPDGKHLTFMGYDSPVDVLDVSNSNTPGVDAPGTNPAAAPHYRVVGEVGTDGKFHFTLTNAFSGDNGRAAILNPAAGQLYMAGNANDSAGDAFITSAGAQITPFLQASEAKQAPGAPTPVASFGVNELGLSEKGDVAKENNYRAVAIENNVLYYVKGSGGKGINTVYFVDTTGKACPNGYGVPQAGAALPTTALAGGNFSVQGGRLTPFNMCVLAGFPQILNGSNPLAGYPFGIWFANPDTMYVADEGNGNGPVKGSYSATDPTNNPTAGLQKWVFDPSAQAWHLAYTVRDGLDLGQPYAVAGYPKGDNNLPGGTGEPWAPATDGIRQLTGRVNPNGSVTLYATTSTVSGSGDQGADPNRLVSVTDQVAALTPRPDEEFKTLATAADGTLFRGVSFAPGTAR